MDAGFFVLTHPSLIRKISIMTITQELLAKIADHEQQIAALREQLVAVQDAEKQATINDLVEKIITFNISPTDLFTVDQLRGRTAERKKPGAKYLDPETGRTWTGHGKAPRWIAGKDKALFLASNAGPHRKTHVTDGKRPVDQH